MSAVSDWIRAVWSRSSYNGSATSMSRSRSATSSPICPFCARFQHGEGIGPVVISLRLPCARLTNRGSWLIESKMRMPGPAHGMLGG